MKRLFYILTIGTITFTSCKAPIEGYSTKDGFTPDIYPHHEFVEEIKPVIVDKSFEYDKTIKNITINKAVILNNELILDITHAGGCGSHDYQLMYNEKVKNQLFLTQNDQDDVCYMKVNKIVKFDLSDIKTSAANPVKLIGYANKIKPVKK